VLNETTITAARFPAIVLIAGQAAVASNPVIVGEISGVEICAQFLEQCKAAVFTGTCDCEIDSRETPGFFCRFRAA